MYVSISAYNDSYVLEEAIKSVRRQLPNAHIAVVDGAYETWPGSTQEPNSSDDTELVAAAHADDYLPAGPFERENDKHQFRVAQAPSDEWALFLDADERLVAFDVDALDTETVYKPRIYNAVVYNENTSIVYWPRVFHPKHVEDVTRWDAYDFSVPAERTNAVTIVHRHDLRPSTYRANKYERFHNEDRIGRYEKRDEYDTYVDNDFEIEPDARCPGCGRESLLESAGTSLTQSDTTTIVQTCLHDGCYTGIREITVDEFEYLPGDWEAGFAEDPERLRAELIKAGCPFARTIGVERFKRMWPSVKVWVEEQVLGTREKRVFG